MRHTTLSLLAAVASCVVYATAANAEVPPEPVEPKAAILPVTPGPPTTDAPCPVVVGPPGVNLPPIWGAYGADVETTRAGQSLTLELDARDPEGKPITYRVVRVPAGARVDWVLSPQEACGEGTRTPMQIVKPRITWTPTRGQYGRHEVELVASDGATETPRVQAIMVEDEWESFFVPGLAYSVYQPKGSSLGLWHGPAFELLIAAWIHRNENRGPSHARIYASVGVLDSTEEDIDQAVAAALGFDLSIERNPRRQFLVPYFGIETGGIFRGKAPSVAQFTPSAGVHLFADRNVFVNASGGYVFPTARIDELLGWTGRVSVNLSFW